jgi:hypothetical protein
MRKFLLAVLVLGIFLVPVQATLTAVDPSTPVPPYVDQQVTAHGLYRDVNKTGDITYPIGLTNTYADTDIRVISYIDVLHLQNNDILKWEFQSPNGEIVPTLTLVYRFTGDYSKTSVYGWKPIRFFVQEPGQWTVIFSINGKKLAEDTFSIAFTGAVTASGGETAHGSEPPDSGGGPADAISALEGIWPVLLVILVIAGIVIYTVAIRRSNASVPPPQQLPAATASPGASAKIAHDVFISYAHVDKPTADAICSTLEGRRIRCWIAPRDVMPGTNYQEAIIDAIDTSRIMVLVFSSHSNTSPHVIRELTKALSQGVIIIPFRIEDVPLSKSMEYLISLPHWLDALTPPVEKHIDKLAEYVEVLLRTMADR